MVVLPRSNPCAESGPFLSRWHRFEREQVVKTDLLGGFFALEIIAGRNGIFQSWSGRRPVACFVNARSALAALIAAERPRAVWLPAFICGALANAVPQPLRQYYPVGATLTPQVSALGGVQSGDMLLGIDYFGYGPARDFADFVVASPEVLFVEDCAHCLAPDDDAWGDWRLFSPRKLLGVADGGILVAMHGDHDVPQPCRASEAPELQWLAPLLRFEDGSQLRSAVWHAANQAKEVAMTVSDAGMTRLSRSLLTMTDSAPLVQKRKANFLALEAALKQWQLPMNRSPGNAPFVFPIRLSECCRDTVLKRLYEDGIYAAVHWRDLPSPVEHFPAEHQLASELISLPCDHRYGDEEMSRIIEAVFRAMR